MVDIKERLEQEKLKLEIFKRSIIRVKNDFHIKDKFYLKMENLMDSNGKIVYEISQNLYSIPFLFSALKYPDSKTCFFVEIINLYQNLEKNVIYKSFSQTFTTYCLILLERNRIIDLISCEKDKFSDLTRYTEMLGNFKYKKTYPRMYEVYFQKLRSLNKKDIPLIKSLAHVLEIDLSNLIFIHKDNKIFIKLNKACIVKQIKNKELFKKMLLQRKNFYIILRKYYSYFLDEISYYTK